MARARKHKDVDFEVDTATGHGRKNFDTWNEAAAYAIATGAARGQRINLDVLIHSRAGARWWGGEHAVEEYDADPDASVSERFVVNVNPQGRIA